MRRFYDDESLNFAVLLGSGLRAPTGTASRRRRRGVTSASSTGSRRPWNGRIVGD
jgi:hypothetical protein